MEEQLLKTLIATHKELLKEIKALRNDYASSQLDTCGPKEASKILGVHNKVLIHFVNIGLLTRRPGGSSFVFYKDELNLLQTKIKSGDVSVPRVRHIPNTKARESTHRKE